jgi:hypothetical protein
MPKRNAQRQATTGQPARAQPDGRRQGGPASGPIAAGEPGGASVAGTAPIELAPHHGRRRAQLRDLRPWARWLHATLALAVVVAVFVQVYLIGAYIFGAGPGALHAHREVGFTANDLEGAVLIAALLAWLPRTDLILSLLLALIGTAQVALANAHRWVGALHPLGALFVLTIATVLVRRTASWRRPDASA